MPAIFISYRRADSQDTVGRIYERLVAHFGREAVFMDVDTIAVGVDFRERLSEAVADCDVLLAVIGPAWVDARYQDGPKRGQRRLDDAEDLVRIEVEAALRRGIPVVPVLVNGAGMPPKRRLPKGLKGLASRNAAEVWPGRDFHDHVGRLIRGIEGFLPAERGYATVGVLPPHPRDGTQPTPVPTSPGARVERVAAGFVPSGRASLPGGVTIAQEERFAPSITAWMARLKRKVEILTAEQVQALHQLRYRNRARITGCAGSGKTLLAAEKAIRLDAAGMRTLVLCHNPNLARHLAALVANPAIDVCDFGTFVHRLAGTVPPEGVGWTAFEEPLEHDLERAADAVSEATAVYEAIIVDEGQDFRENWWALLDALLEYSRTKTLYIFHDDNQALLPHRATYPISQEPVSMSKNCRNGGDIFEIVRRFHRDAPLVSNFLTAEGVARVSPFDEQDWQVRLEEALLDAHQYTDHAQIRVITNEPSAETSKINGFEFVRQPERRWRTVVEGDLNRLRNKALTRLAGLRSGSSHSEIANRFSMPLRQCPQEYLSVPQLSQEAIPNTRDILAVRLFAARLLPFFGGTVNPSVRFATRNQELYLSARAHTGKETTVNDTSRAYFYAQSKWASSLQPGRPTTVLAHRGGPPQDDVVALYSVDTFKGLECDALVVFVNSVTHSLLREMYVASSRAVAYLNIVISRSVLSRLASLADLDRRFLSG